MTQKKLSIETLKTLPEGTLMEFAKLDKSKKNYSDLEKQYTDFKKTGEPKELLELMQKNSFYMMTYFMGIDNKDNIGSIIISNSAELIDIHEIEFHRPKKLGLDELTYLAIPQKIPEYELRDMMLCGNVLTPREQTLGVRSVIDYCKPTGGCWARAGYLVGVNLGKGFLRQAHGYKPNHRSQDKEDYPLDYHSIENIPKKHVFSSTLYSEGSQIQIFPTSSK